MMHLKYYKLKTKIGKFKTLNFFYLQYNNDPKKLLFENNYYVLCDIYWCYICYFGGLSIFFDTQVFSTSV